MKVKTFKSKQILLLYLLKSKTYEPYIKKKNLNLLVKSCLMKVLISFKKSLQIIFKYHTKNKLILFIGLPDILSVKINKVTRHVALSKYDNLHGNILNVSKYKNVVVSVKNNLAKKKFEKKPYLIVLLDHVNANDIVKESYLAKIPLIYINTNYNKKNFLYHNIYKVSITQSVLQPLFNFFFVGLSFLFK